MTSTVFLRELMEEKVHVTSSAGASTIVADLPLTLPELSASEQDTPVRPNPSGSATVTLWTPGLSGICGVWPEPPLVVTDCTSDGVGEEKLNVPSPSDVTTASTTVPFGVTLCASVAEVAPA